MAGKGEDIDFDPLGTNLPDEEEDLDDDESSELLKKDKKISELTKTKEKFDPYGGKARHKKPLIGEDEETDFGGHENISLLQQELREEVREEVKKHYPKMSLSVEVKQIEKKGISFRLFGDTKWTLLFTKKGELSKKINKDLKKALGPTANEIIDKNEEENSRDREEIIRMKELGEAKEEKDQVRIGELREEAERTDISTEVRETTINEIEERRGERNQERETTIDKIDERIDEREQESERIDERMSLTHRIRENFKKHGLTVFSILTSTGTIISVIVLKLTSGLSKIVKGVGNGLKALGKKLAQILPGMVGAIASFLFRTAGDALGFLAKNSWLLILAVVTLAVEQYTKKKK